MILLIYFLSLVTNTCYASRIISSSPDVSPWTTTGMLIDAGSGGSRLHIFHWKPRVFDQIPPPLSYPEPDEKWTAVIEPGIHTLHSTDDVRDHLYPLVDFARRHLTGSERHFKNFPIYFKATGGMRELDSNHRDRIINRVRELLSDSSFNPFYFREDFARIISGEEEAIYSWAATNFLMGTLLPNSNGIGMVLDVNSTYGTLDLGGASTQIAFYVPSLDILEGLYKFQLGSQKQWNVYTKSFLQFGAVSALQRHLEELVNTFYLETKRTPNGLITVVPKDPYVTNYCFHAQYSEFVTGSFSDQPIEVKGPPLPDPNQLKKCMDSLTSLLEKKYGAFCENVYHGDCSIAGAYQPPLPNGQHGHFIGTSHYKYPWKFLKMPETSTLDLFEQRASNICKLSFGDLLFYYESNNFSMDPDNLAKFLPYYCFLSSYVLVLLKVGYRFEVGQTLTVIDELNGNKVGWSLGAMLYEINEMPWELSQYEIGALAWGFIVLAAVFGLIIGMTAGYCVYREVVEDLPQLNKKPLEADSLNRSYTIDTIRNIPKTHTVGIKTSQSPSLSRNSSRGSLSSEVGYQTRIDVNDLNSGEKNRGRTSSNDPSTGNEWFSNILDYKPFQKKDYNELPT